MPDPDQPITITLSRVTAAALLVIADLGVKAAEAFGLVQNTARAREGADELRAELRRTEAQAAGANRIVTSRRPRR